MSEIRSKISASVRPRKKSPVARLNIARANAVSLGARSAWAPDSTTWSTPSNNSAAVSALASLSIFPHDLSVGTLMRTR